MNGAKTRRFRPAWPVTVIIIGVCLRFYRLGARSFWCDEFLALSLSRLEPLFSMLRWVTVNDAHPPLFYLLIRAVARHGRGELLLRLLPALAGAAALAVFYRLVRRFGHESLRPAVLLLALAPAAVLWSQMVKAYSLLTLLSLLSVYFFFAWREKPGRCNLAGWVLATLAAMYTHNYGALLPAGQVIFAALRRRETPPRRMIPPLALIAAGYLPYLVLCLPGQLAFVRGATHSVTSPLLRGGYTLFYFIFGETLFPLDLALVLPGALVFTAAVAAGLLRRDPPPLVLFARVAAGLALAVIFAVPATIPQNLVHLQPFFLLAAAHGFAALEPRTARRAAATAAACLLPALWFYHAGASRQFHDPSKLVPYRETAARLEREAEPGEVIAFTEPRDTRFISFFPPYAPWDWYYRGSNSLREISPAAAPDPTAALVQLAGEAPGFWLLVTGTVPEPWLDKLHTALDDLQAGGKLVKIKEERLVEDRSFRARLAGEPAPARHFFVIYRFRGKEPS